MIKWFVVIAMMTVTGEVETNAFLTPSKESCLNVLEAVLYNARKNESIISLGCEGIYIGEEND